jgi:hypothetical protein
LQQDISRQNISYWLRDSDLFDGKITYLLRIMQEAIIDFSFTLTA